MATRRKRSAEFAAAAKRMMLNPIQEEQPSSSSSADICTYWPANPAFDPKWVIFRRQLFINEDKTKYFVGF